jgi:UDP-glucuronate decarboxylase
MDPNDGRVISNLIVQALTGRDITINGDGSQSRSFQYVDDLIIGLIRFMQTPDSLTGPVNLGNPDEITILDLAEKIVHLTRSRSKIVFQPRPADYPARRKPDVELAKRNLDNWHPQITLDDGLERTIAYFKYKIK